jgi:isoleucyl-tRNA synthetase
VGRNVRNEAGIRVRQPLGELIVHSEHENLSAFLEQDEVVASVLEELNVREVRSTPSIDAFARLKAKPNFPALGKRFGKRVPAIAETIKQLDTSELVAFDRTGDISVDTPDGNVALTRDELTVDIEGKGGYGVSAEKGITVVLNLEITDELRLEGLAREVVNRLQNLRKKAGLEVTDRIRVRYQGGDKAVEVFGAQGDLIQSETLAVDMAPGEADWEHSVSFEIDDAGFQLWLRKAD